MKIVSTTGNEVFYATKYSAGFDIPVAEDVTLYSDEIKVVSTGLYLEADVKDYEVWMKLRYFPYLMLTPRSGMAKRGITLANSPAIIDFDYRGEIKLILHNRSQDVVTIPKGTRVAQGIFQMAYRPESIKVKDVERGEGGLGSTGEK